MGYKFNNAPPPKPNDMLPAFHVYNGSTETWSFPCYYLEVDQPIDWHDYHTHDFWGWPAPDHPDHICQMLPDYHHFLSPASVWKYIDMRKAIPIHLLSDYENYEPVGSVMFDEYDDNGDGINLTGVDAQIAIRPAPDDWIIDLYFNPSIAPFSDKPREFNFNAYFKMNSDQESGIYHVDRHDIFLRGKLVVLPGPQSSQIP